MDYTATSYEVINVGNNRTVSLMEMIQTLEEVCGRKAVLDRKSEQPGDVPQTYADLTKAKALLNYQPRTDFKTGIERFYQWFTREAGGHAG